MINFNYIATENTKESNPNWTHILDHLHRISIIGGSEP